MTKWKDDSGRIFETAEEAFDHVRVMMDTHDYKNYFRQYIDFDELLDWAWSHDDFFDDFINDFDAAEEEFFTQHYQEIEDE